MSDYSLPLHITLVFGQGACGKTSFCLRYLLNVPDAACIFIFDDRCQAASRLKLMACGTARECEEAVPTGWVCFNPHVMFPGAKLKDGFRWFCDWVFRVSQRGAGRKIVFVDELWQWCDGRSLPTELENLVRTGRVEGIELLFATQRPRDFHVDIRAQVTEWVGFQLAEPAELAAVRPYFSDVDACGRLHKLHFLALNRESGAKLAGKLA